MTALPPSGHELSLRVETPEQRARQRASGSRYQLVALIVGAAFLVFLGAIGVMEWPFNGSEWTSIITGTLCGTVVFVVVPWSIGAAKRRKATQTMYLNGNHLNITGKADKGGGTLDLSRIRAEVRLDWLVDSDLINSKALTEEQRQTRIDLVHKSLDRRIARGVTPCVYVPVLILHREDGTKIPILLADSKTREIRATAEIHMLERAMQFNADPATQHAVAQLRTVARWPRLPAIYDARPDAIPPTPADHPFDAPPPLTPVRGGASDPVIHVEGGGWSHPFGTGSADGPIT